MFGTAVLWLWLCEEKVGSWLCRGDRVNGDLDIMDFI